MNLQNVCPVSTKKAYLKKCIKICHFLTRELFPFLCEVQRPDTSFFYLSDKSSQVLSCTVFINANTASSIVYATLAVHDCGPLSTDETGDCTPYSLKTFIFLPIALARHWHFFTPCELCTFEDSRNKKKSKKIVGSTDLSGLYYR